jgi:hypothetical protein
VPRHGNRGGPFRKAHRVPGRGRLLFRSAGRSWHFRRDDDPAGVKQAESIEELGGSSKVCLLLHVRVLVLKRGSNGAKGFATTEQFCAQKFQELWRQIVSSSLAEAGDEVFRRRTCRFLENRSGTLRVPSRVKWARGGKQVAEQYSRSKGCGRSKESSRGLGTGLCTELDCTEPDCTELDNRLGQTLGEAFASWQRRLG